MIVRVELLRQVEGELGQVRELEGPRRAQDLLLELGGVKNEVPEVDALFFRQVPETDGRARRGPEDVLFGRSLALPELAENAVQSDERILEVGPGFPLETQRLFEIEDDE